VGDPKQSQPINLSSGERGNDDYYNSFNAIDTLAKLVDDLQAIEA
jgi:hypothetical protein